MKTTDDLGFVHLDKQQLRQAEQATFAYRGTFIVSQWSTTVIPAWKVKREKLAAQMGSRPILRRVR